MRLIFSIIVATIGFATSGFTQGKIFTPEGSPFMRWQEVEDVRLIDSLSNMIDLPPTASNYKSYVSLARALWQMNRLAEAKKMFLAILDSGEEYYSRLLYNSSDVPGDTATKRYGYGSFTSHYKNEASYYLSKICIEQGEFDRSLEYINDAVNKYKVEYNCGTGAYAQKSRYREIYAYCYEGLGYDDRLIELLLPICMDDPWEIKLLANALKRRYPEKVLLQNLQTALGSIQFEANPYPATSTTVSYQDGVRGAEEKHNYYFGSYTVTVFDRTIKVYDLESDVPITRAYCENDFAKSPLYRELTVR